MPVVIRLARMGRKNIARFRLVAADHRMKRDGRFLEVLGTYNPQANPKEFIIDARKVASWIAKGAQPSETVHNLLVQDRFFEKREAIAKGLDPETLNVPRLAERKRKPKTRKQKSSGGEK